MKAATSRLVGLTLGMWLFLSAFIWTHTAAQFANAWIVGLSLIAATAMAARIEAARYVCTMLAVWLFFSNWILQTDHGATTWNNIIVAVLAFLVST